MKYLRNISLAAVMLIAANSHGQSNWADVKLYDNNGAVMSQTRSYMDALGRTVQEQSLDITNGNVLANQPVFDAFGRPVLQTLTAPVFQTTLNYKDKFMEDASGNNYSWDDFDKPNTTVPTPGSVNKPNPVKNTAQGSAGWYYSNSNTSEPYVPVSAFPYSRVEFYADPLERVKRVTTPEEKCIMGSGREQKTYYMSNAGELYYAFGYKGSAILGMEDNTALFSANENLQATKTVSVDPDNKVSIVYQTLSGQTIATCLSGQPNPGCLTQKVMQTMSYAGERGVSLHLPPACNSTLKFPIPAEAWSHGIRDQFNGSGTAQIDYKITDLSTGKLLTPGTDYTFNRNNRVVTFKPNYQNRHLFLRVSFNYNAANSGKRSDLAVSYELDYDYWSLSFYDTKGQLVRSVPPHAINCNYNPLANNTLTNSYSTYDILQKGPAVNQLLETTSLAAQGGFDQNLFYSVQALSKPNGSSGGTGSQSTRSSLNAVSASGDPIDNASIISAIESAGVQTRQFYDLNLTDPDMIHFWGKVELTFQLYGTQISSGALVPIQEVPKSTLYLQASYWFNLQKPAIAPSNINVNPYPGWDAHFAVPQSILSNYSKVELRLIDIAVRGLHYDNSGSGLLGDQLIANNLIDNAFSNIRMGVTTQLSSYPTPSPYYVNLSSGISYNKLGWPIKSISPDEGEVHVIYDTEGKLRFKQNARQLADGGLFNYFVFDRAGRIVETGEFNPNLRVTGPVVHFQPYDAAGDPPNPLISNSVHTVVDITQAGWRAYDNHCTQQSWFTYDQVQNDFPATLTGYSQRYADGQLVKSSNTYGTSWYGYDDGANTWVVRSINDLGTKTVNYYYTKEGQLDKIDYQKEVPAERFVHQYVYDANKRPVEVKTSLDNAVFTSNQSLQYYLHGALKRTELGGTLQGLDYVYTASGRLKSVNAPALTNRDPGKDGYPGTHAGFKKDVFGFTLDYFTGDYVRKNTFIDTYTPNTINRTDGFQEQFGGNIRAMRWQTLLPAGASASTAFPSGMLQYLYRYDARNQLCEAVFGKAGAGTLNGPAAGTSPSFTAEPNAYRINNMSYDKAGNIKTLKRQGKPGALPMDDLNYNYAATLPNRLTSVTDNAAAGAYKDDLESQAANNYLYNGIGQLITDVMADQNYAYDPAGNVTAITHSNGTPLLRFEYNETGLRQRKVTYDNSGNELKSTWYVYGSEGSLMSVYETQAGATIQTELPVYGMGRAGVYDKGSNSYTYELTDHLGNVRATVRQNAGVAEVLLFNDYYPHGSVMPGRNFNTALPYRFDYQGQEKDVETGFSNFELRQYDGRLGRWFNPDPMGQYHSPYLAMGNNPVSYLDPTGGWDSDDGYTHHMDGVMAWMEEFGMSEFDRNFFGFPGPFGGSFGADGMFTANETWVSDVHELWKKLQESKDYVGYYVDAKTGKTIPNQTIEVVGYRSDMMYEHIKNKAKDVYNMASVAAQLASETLIDHAAKFIFGPLADAYGAYKRNPSQYLGVGVSGSGFFGPGVGLDYQYGYVKGEGYVQSSSFQIGAGSPGASVGLSLNAMYTNLPIGQRSSSLTSGASYQLQGGFSPGVLGISGGLSTDISGKNGAVSYGSNWTGFSISSTFGTPGASLSATVSNTYWGKTTAGTNPIMEHVMTRQPYYPFSNQSIERLRSLFKN